jgi:NADH-quinone oxidoreductase subunit A
VVVATMFGLISVTMSSLIGPKKPSALKLSPYESGCEPVGNARERFSIKFYLIAMLFILFDIEAVFLYPWAVVFKQFIKAGAGAFIFGEMLVFIVILFVGYIYIWKKGALEWE